MSKRHRGRTHEPDRAWPAKGKRPKSTAQERIEYVREQWARDPNIPINGRNGMNQRLMDVFGLPARAEQLMALRNEMLEERRRRASDAPPIPKVATPVISPSDILKFEKMYKPKEPEVEDKNATPMVPAPGAGRTMQDAKVRFDFARAYIERHPLAHNAEVIDACRREFGMGIDGNALGTIRRQLGVGFVKKRRTELARPTPPAPPTKPEPVRVAQVEHRSVKSEGYDERNAIRAAVQMLIDEVPGLRRLELTIVDGKPKISYDVEVNRVETGEVVL